MERVKIQINRAYIAVHRSGKITQDVHESFATTHTREEAKRIMDKRMIPESSYSFHPVGLGI